MDRSDDAGARGEREPAADELIPRPPRPAKSYRIGVLEPNMAIPHFVAQAYGFVDEAVRA